MSKEERSLELYWVDYCYENIIKHIRSKTHLKEFDKGYNSVREIIKEHQEKEAKYKDN